MTGLEKKALFRTSGFSASVALLLLLPGGPDFWQGWLYSIIFTLCSLTIALYFSRHHPCLIERRLSARTEKDKTQERIRGILSLSVILLFGVAGIDHRLGWSDVSAPAPVVAVANMVVVLGFVIVFRTFQANSHAVATVDVTPDQRVVSTGPYALVRHPMYLGGALVVLATPFALGSMWAFPWSLATVACLAWRLVGEEKYLSLHLPGYNEYREHIRYRLIPFIW
jgi:protein-S-isoprenylcysteine O-methyltransferase Ste14